MRAPGLLSTGVLLGLLGCGQEPLSFAEEPRPCEVRGEVCPAKTPTLLQVADLENDGIAEFITAGLSWELSIAASTENGFSYVTTHVPVERAELSSCSSVEGTNDLVFYRNWTSGEWWLWRLSEGRLEVVDSGRHSLETIVACVDLGPGADVIATQEKSTLVLPSFTFELQPVDTFIYAMATMPSDDGSTFSLFEGVGLSPDLYYGTFDLNTGEIVQEGWLSLNLTRNNLVAVAGRDLIVAGRVNDDPELVIVRNLEPTAPVVEELERVSLPWRARFLEVAELDGDDDIEVVIAPMPVTAVAVFGLTTGQSDLYVLDLPFEAIDIASGDHDGDGKDEIYALDPRDERIVEIKLE